MKVKGDQQRELIISQSEDGVTHDI